MGAPSTFFFPAGDSPAATLVRSHVLETAAKPCWGPLIRQWPASMPRLPHLPHRRDENQNEWTRKRGERRGQRRGCVAEASPHQHMTSSPAMRCCCPALRCVCCDLWRNCNSTLVFSCFLSLSSALDHLTVVIFSFVVVTRVSCLLHFSWLLTCFLSFFAWERGA